MQQIQRQRTSNLGGGGLIRGRRQSDFLAEVVSFRDLEGRCSVAMETRGQMNYNNMFG
jgi:hypothetical protein